MIQKKIPFDYLIILLLALLFAVRAHYPEINPYKVYPDLSSMAEYLTFDKTDEFPDILSKTLNLKENLSTPMKIEGISLTLKYLFLDNFLTVTAFKIFGIVMYLFAVFLVHILSKKLFKAPIAIAVTVLFSVYMLTLNTFAGGNFRCVGFCFLLLFLICISYQRYILASILMIITAIYPYNIPFMGMLLLIKAFSDFNLSKKQKIFFLLLLFCIGIVLLTLNFGGVSAIGILTNKNFHISLDYKYKLNIEGLWSDAPIINFIKHMILNFQEHQNLYSIYTIIYLSFFLFFYKKNIFINDLFWSAVSSFLIITTVVNASIASRILLFAVPIILILHLGFLMQRFKLDTLQKRKSLYLMVITLTLPFLLFFQSHLVDLTNYRNIYTYIKNIQDKKTLLFGHQETMEFMPFYTHKKTFSSARVEYSFPLKGALDYLDKRNKEIISLLYSNDIDFIKKRLRDKKVTYVVLEDYFYEPEYLKNKYWTYLQYGYLKDIKNFIEKQNSKKDFALYTFVKNNYDFADKENGLYIMSTKKLFKTIS